MANFIKGIGSAARGFAVGSSEVEAMYLGETKIYEKPYDAKIEYLKSSSSQWIDTGIVPTGYTGIEVKFKYNVTTNQMRLFESRKSDNDLVIGSYINGLGYFATAFSKAGDWLSTNVIADTSVHTLKIDPNLSVYVDGVVKNTRSSRPTATTSENIRLFSYGSYNDNAYRFSGNIYYVKIWDNDTLVRDFIPVRVGTIGYLYDKVSGQLFGNSGSGSFTLGPDI